MSIVFTLPESAAEQVAFCYSPLLESVLSLHVLVEPKHHPVQHEWVRSMRRLPPRLKREIEVFAFAFRAYFPEFLFPAATGEMPDLASELRRLRDVPDDVVRMEFAIPLAGRQVGGEIPRDPSALDAPEARRMLADRAAVVADAELATAMANDPRAVLERFVAMLETYWQEAFEAEWVRIEPELAASVSEAGRLIRARGVFGLLSGLGPDIRCDREARRFWLDRPHDHEVEIGAEQQLVLAPSVYVWPHVRVNCDAPWPLGLVFPASSILREARPRIPPAQLTAVLRALGDDTRLRALRLIAERPRSTQELAPLVGVTEAALSKHLRALADAGLLERHRDGYYVLYRLIPQRVAAVGASLEEFLADI